MAIYTIHIPPDGNPEKARFLSEDRNFLALVLPLIWLLWHGLWVELLGFVAIGMLIGFTAQSLGPFHAVALTLLPGLFLFLEGNQLLRARLSRKGWIQQGIVEAGSAAEAEIRYFAAEAGPENARSPGHRAAQPVPASHPPSAVPGIGMFPE